MNLPPGSLVAISKASGVSNVSMFESPDYSSRTIGFMTEGELANVVSTVEVKRSGLVLRWVFLIINDGTVGWTDRIEYLESIIQKELAAIVNSLDSGI